MMARQEIQCEIAIVGAGLIGSSLAWHLARLGATGVRVFDLDLEGSLSSSELNAGGVRATLGHPLNIQMSMMSIDYFASVAQEIGYRDCGYLWLRTPESMAVTSAARERQRKLGWEVQEWGVDELRRRVPLIDKTSDLAGAVFAPRDGLMNPNLLKTHFRTQARSLGVGFEDRVRVLAAEVSEGGVVLLGKRWAKRPSLDELGESLAGASIGVEEQDVEIRCARVVNCAGAWAAGLALALGYPCPSKAQRQQISIFDGRGLDLSPYGMIIDTSGVYFHPEATNGLAGVCLHQEPNGVNFRYDGEAFFNELIWPSLYERSSAFESLKHLTGWAGQYEVSPDDSAIIGEVELGAARGTGRVFEAHSFSGHGAMHSPAAGLLLAEKILKGRYETLDISALSGTRFETGQLVRESAVI
jgi:FAD-dependent oxidoreductase domain-containing protein 1